MADSFYEDRDIHIDPTEEIVDDHSILEAPDVVTDISLPPLPRFSERLYAGRGPWPLCFHLPHLEQGFEMNPNILGRLPGFSGLPSESAVDFLRRFEEMSLLTGRQHDALDDVRFRLLPLSLMNDAQRWLYLLPPNSIGSWVDFCEAFLKKYVPGYDSTKRGIRLFKQQYKEPFWKCFDRFQDLLIRCPHHDIPLHVLCHIVFDALNISTRKDLQVNCDGSFLDYPGDVGWESLKAFAIISKHWETVGETFETFGARSSVIESKRDKAEIAALKQRIHELERIKESRSCATQYIPPRFPPAPHMPQLNQPQRPLHPSLLPPRLPSPVPQNPPRFQTPQPNMQYYQSPFRTPPPRPVQRMPHPQAYPLPAYVQPVYNQFHSHQVVSQPAAVPYGVLPIQYRPPVPHSHSTPPSPNQLPALSASSPIEKRIAELESRMKELLGIGQPSSLPEPKDRFLKQIQADLFPSTSDAGRVSAESIGRTGKQVDYPIRSESCQYQIRGSQVSVPVVAPHDLIRARESDRAHMDPRRSGGRVEQFKR